MSTGANTGSTGAATCSTAADLGSTAQCVHCSVDCSEYKIELRVHWPCLSPGALPFLLAALPRYKILSMPADQTFFIFLGCSAQHSVLSLAFIGLCQKVS